MIFDLYKTEIFRDVKRARFFIFKFSGFLSQLFLFLFACSLAVLIFSFSGFISNAVSLRYSALFFSLYLIFYNLNVFFNVKIKKPSVPANTDNLAEFLDIETAQIVEDCINFCQKRKIAVNSTSLFYSAVKASKEISAIAFRLGINIKNLRDDLKNYVEKSERGKGENYEISFTKDFEQVIEESFNIAKERQNSRIGEKEILVGLAFNNDFFKKVLVDCDLKKEDIKNITFWFDSVEKSLQRYKEFWSYENLARQGSFGKDWASGYTITLDQFSTDWRKVVSKWAFREIVGHKKEIEEAEMALARSQLANVLLVGETGTGRKSIIEAIAQRCYLGQTLPELNNKRVVELDLVTLAATIQDPERLESMLDQIFSEVLTAGNVILAINDLENFVGLKINKPGQVDISAILAKYLAIPSFQFIGVTSYPGLHNNIEQNPSFAQFFRKIEVGEVTQDETIKILQYYALEAEKKNKIWILYPAIREIVNLTERYMPSLPFPAKAIDTIDEAVVYVQALKEKVVLPHHIAELISKKTEVPVGKMEVKEKETLLNLENLIHKRIVNQEEAVKQISIAMRRARSGLGSKKRPMGTFLFMGPTGVGKTETSKALAAIYFGSEEKMHRLDMSEFQSITDIPRLIGAQSPVEMQGLLTTPVRETPFSLVLVDEIEKAHPNILNLFLQILDEGYITDGQGRKVVFTNTIIICTSNAAADLIFKEVESGNPVNKDELVKFLIDKGLFKPEFINRFDATVVFHPLSKDNLLKIAQLSLEGLQKNLKEKEIDLEITDNLKEKIVALSYKPEFGAREMRRVIQDKVENIIAEALISDRIKKGDHVSMNPDTFELLINHVDN